MQFSTLVNGVLVRRYKRFLVDVELADGDQVTAHCANTGSMRSCLREGAPVQLSDSANPRRKLSWTLERIDMGAGWIGVNTQRPNQLVRAALEEGALAAFRGYQDIVAEPRLTISPQLSGRLDFRLAGHARHADCFIEVKNVTLLQQHRLLFPDAVSARAGRHLRLLLELAQNGERAVLLFLLNRPEGRCFGAAEDIDPAYARGLREAAAAGVEVRALRVRHHDQAMELAEVVPWCGEPDGAMAAG